MARDTVIGCIIKLDLLRAEILSREPRQREYLMKTDSDLPCQLSSIRYGVIWVNATKAV